MPPHPEVLDLPDGDAWEAWLEEHHSSVPEAWLRIAKRHSGISTLGIDEAADGAHCFGWIDGQRRSLDEVSFLQRYCPRRSGGSWSQVNVAKVERLIAAGRMRPTGLDEVEAARADGRWEGAYASQRTANVPDDLAAALAADDRARSAFDSLVRGERYLVLLPLLKARTPAARTRELAKALERLVP